MTKLNKKSSKEDYKNDEGGQGRRVGSILKEYLTLKRIIPLIGESYEPIRKLLFHSLVGNALKPKRMTLDINSGLALGKPDLSMNMIRVGIVEIDTRINLAIFLKSGYGKKELENVIRKSIEGMGLKYSEPTGFHPENLIGKIQKDKNGVEVPKVGYFGDDYFVYDEAKDLLRGYNKEDARQYIKKGLNPIGKNLIEKDNIDNSQGNKLKYIPVASITLFCQPIQLQASLIIEGLMRRFAPIEIDVPETERYASVYQSLDSTYNDVDKDWELWLDFLNKLHTRNWKWIFDKIAIERVKNKIQELIQMSQDRRGSSKVYGDTMAHDIMHYLLRFSVNYAVCNNRDNITIEDVDAAYDDLSDIWNHTLDFIDKRCSQIKDESNTIPNYIINCLKILNDEKAISHETSNISVQEYKEKISKVISNKDPTTDRVYRNLMQRKMIESRMKGQHDSRVWLTSLGKITLQPSQPDNPESDNEAVD